MATEATSYDQQLPHGDYELPPVAADAKANGMRFDENGVAVIEVG